MVGSVFFFELTEVVAVHERDVDYVGEDHLHRPEHALFTDLALKLGADGLRHGLAAGRPVGLVSAYEVTGEEMDEKITLRFSDPIELLGAKASKAELFLGGNFNVWADFVGDPTPVIKEMNLAQTDAKNKNDFVSPPPPKNDCPPTKGLKKSGKSTFRFGCGWCNGG